VGTGQYHPYPAVLGQLDHINAPLGPDRTITLSILAGAKRILYTEGKTSRQKGWLRTGTDKLAS